MKRKLILQGRGGFTVYLPAKWLKAMGLGMGDDVDIEEDGSTLIVRAKKKPAVKKTSIRLADHGPLGGRAIGALYKQGYDEIDVKFKSAADIRIVNKNLNEFIGFETVRQTNQGCLIKEITIAKEEEFDLLLNRTMLLLKAISEDCYNSIKANDTAALKSLPSRDATINKYANYCRRVLNKYGYKDVWKTPMLYYIVEELENLGDEYKKLVELILEKRIRLTPQQLNLLDDVNILLDQFYHLVLKYDLKKAAALYSENKKINTKIHKLEKTNDAAKARVVDSISGMARIIMNMMGPLMTMELS